MGQGASLKTVNQRKHWNRALPVWRTAALTNATFVTLAISCLLDCGWPDLQAHAAAESSLPMPTIIREYNLSVVVPKHWIQLYPRAQKGILRATNKLGSALNGSVVVEINVERLTSSTDESLKPIIDLRDFGDIARIKTEEVSIIGQNVRLESFSFRYRHGDRRADGIVSRSLFTHGGLVYELLWRGTRENVSLAEADLLSILNSIATLDESWTPSAGRLAYLEGAEVCGTEARFKEALPYFPKPSRWSPTTRNPGYCSAWRCCRPGNPTKPVSNLRLRVCWILATRGPGLVWATP